jgi:pimeloyl-ACP methyl ester carboxylesterase
MLDSLLTLRDGRSLSYALSGDPAGKPVFYFHGWPGSRLEVELLAPAALAAGLSLIAVDRPGYGGSSFKPGRALAEWPADVAELADALGHRRFAAAGVSGGGPYAAAVARFLGPRLTAVAIVCGLGPTDRSQATKGMMPVNRFIFGVAARVPPVLRALLALMARELRRRPETAMPRILAGLPEVDRRVLQRPEMAAIFSRSTLEAFRHGTRGAAWDGRLYVRPWGFRVQEIEVPVHLWHGEVDRNVPIAMGRLQAEAIPRCQAHFFADEGHLSLVVNRASEILAALA